MSNKIFFFTDIDDTLIQTKRKTDFTKNTFVGSFNKDGQNSSFFYEGTKVFIDKIINSGINVIPTTARNLDSYKRTVFYKNEKIKNVILNFGGLVLINNKEDVYWSDQIKLKYKKIKLINILSKELNYFLSLKKLNLRIKIIDNYYISIYNEKNIDNDLILLSIKDNLNIFISKNPDFYLYENKNSFGILPNFLNKKFAVEYMINKFSPLLTIGAGDNHSDLDFMRLTNFMLLPNLHP
jgi:hypothetical protein